MMNRHSILLSLLILAISILNIYALPRKHETPDKRQEIKFSSLTGHSTLQTTPPLAMPDKHVPTNTVLTQQQIIPISQYNGNGLHHPSYANIIWRNLYIGDRSHAIPQHVLSHIIATGGTTITPSPLMPPTPYYADWRETGMLEPVTETYSCIGAHASTLLRSHGIEQQRLYGIPEQFISGQSLRELVMCCSQIPPLPSDWNFGQTRCFGCAEGYLEDAIKYQWHLGGVCGETLYPPMESWGDMDIDELCDTSAVWACSANGNLGRGKWRWVDYRTYTPHPQVYKNILASSPIMMNIHIPWDALMWINYAGGLITINDCPGLQETPNGNTTMELVGYIPEDHPNNIFGIFYWIFKTAYGPTWGYNGHVYITDEPVFTGGTCGMYKSTATPYWLQYVRTEMPAGIV